MAFFLSKEMLPKARIKNKPHREVANLVETRDKLVKLRTVLLNEVHGLQNTQGIKLRKESLSSKKGLLRALDYNLDDVAQIENIIEQVQQLNKSIIRMDEVLSEQAKKLDCYERL